MDLEWSAEDRSFRDEAREWLHANVPKERPPDDGPALRAYDLAWQATQFKAGWAGISWPVEYGGRGLSLLHQMIWHEEYARAGAPNVGTEFVGLNDAGPTLMLHGRPDQQAAYLPAILRGEAIWAQGYSEPEAGSDLAALSTSAVVDGDELVVTGEKIWTSYADIADHQELLVRTDPEAERHQGISWVICDLDPRPAGLSVSTIESISGIHRLCRVTYDGVRIPLDHVVGPLHGGWGVVSSSLYLKRGTGRIADQVALAHVVEQLVALAGEVTGPDGRRPALADDELARRLGRARAEVAALRAMTYAELSRVARDGTPGPEGSLGRLYHARLSQDVRRLAVDLLGPAMLDLDERGLTKEYLWSMTETVGGGTSDVQLNAVAERLLGLPRSR